MAKIKYDYKKQCAISPLNAVGPCSSSLRPFTPQTDDFSRFVAENGSDSTGDGTRANPYKTIMHAIDNLDGRNIITFIRKWYDW